MKIFAYTMFFLGSLMLVWGIVGEILLNIKEKQILKSYCRTCKFHKLRPNYPHNPQWGICFKDLAHPYGIQGFKSACSNYKKKKKIK